MSRITRGRVDVGETADASTLNGTYADFNQPAALNAYNTRDQAFDLPHINAPIILNQKSVALANTSILHGPLNISTAPVTTNSAAPITTAVANRAGTQTPLDLSSAPWSMVDGDVLRVWWNLSVNPYYTGTPWAVALPAAALGQISVPLIGGGNTLGYDSLYCWVIYLQWDITSAGLLNWTAVPGQTAFNSAIDTHVGGTVADMPASSVVSAWTVYEPGNADEGEIPVGGAVGVEQKWFSNYGMWAYPATGAVTIYGLRLVITGVFHPWHRTTGSNENSLVYDTAVSAGAYAVELRYQGGRLNAVHMRGS